MNWNSVKLACESIFLLVAAGSAVYAAHQIHEAVQGINAVTAEATSTLDAVNQPCGHGHPCGALAVLNKTITKSGDAVVTTQIQERTATKHLTALMDTANATIGKVGGLASEGTELAHNASGAVLSIQQDADALRPTLVAATGAVESFGTAAQSLNGRINDPRIDATLSNVADLTDNANGIAANFRVTTGMVNHYLQPILQPTPCPKKGHLGCELRRHALGWLTVGARTGESIYWTRANF